MNDHFHMESPNADSYQRERVSVFGFVTRPTMGLPMSLDVLPGETRETRFPAGAPGTYHYWATSTGRPLVQRGDVDSQLNGAFIVDPPGAVPEDRILVVSLWRKPGSVPAQWTSARPTAGHGH